jgi:hypothetical protein
MKFQKLGIGRVSAALTFGSGDVLVAAERSVK